MQAMMACLIHVALGRWRAMCDDLDNMGFLKDKIDRDDLARDLQAEVTKVWPLAGSFGAESFLSDGTAQEGGLLASRIADGTVRPELGLGQGLSFGKLAKVCKHLSARCAVDMLSVRLNAHVLIMNMCNVHMFDGAGNLVPARAMANSSAGDPLRFGAHIFRKSARAPQIVL